MKTIEEMKRQLTSMFKDSCSQSSIIAWITWMQKCTNSCYIRTASSNELVWEGWRPNGADPNWNDDQMATYIVGPSSASLCIVMTSPLRQYSRFKSPWKMSVSNRDKNVMTIVFLTRLTRWFVGRSKRHFHSRLSSKSSRWRGRSDGLLLFTQLARDVCLSEFELSFFFRCTVDAGRQRINRKVFGTCMTEKPILLSGQIV